MSGTSHLQELISSFRRGEEGGIAIFAALTLPILVGFAGLGVETAIWYKNDASTKTAADIAAHASAVELQTAGEDETIADQVAVNAAMQLGFKPGDVTTKVSSTSDGLRVDVSVNTTAKRYFSSILGNSDDITISAQSAAVVEAAGEACLLALDPDSDGIQFGGNTDISLNGCLVMSNATDDDALSLNGSATLAASCAAAVGDVDIQKADSVSFSECSEARSSASPTIDPYEGLTMPSLTSGTYASCASLPASSKGKKSGGSSAIQSGRYCGGLTFTGNMEIEDGATLIIDGGKFKNQGPASLSGTNVTIIFMNDVEMFLTSQADLDLTAKTTGEYSGLIFIGDAATQDTSHRFNGGSDTRLQGAFYFPTDSLELRGGANVTAGCLHMIAKDIDTRGNSRFSNNCASAGTKPLVVSGGVRVVR